jgi:hypothetical protein
MIITREPPQEAYLVVAHCQFDDYPISLHGDLESAIQAAAKVTPKTVGECARIAKSHQDASAVQAIEISVMEFRKGELVRVHRKEMNEVRPASTEHINVDQPKPSWGHGNPLADKPVEKPRNPPTAQHPRDFHMAHLAPPEHLAGKGHSGE